MSALEERWHFHLLIIENQKMFPSQTSTAHQQRNCRQRRYLMGFIIHPFKQSRFNRISHHLFKWVRVRSYSSIPPRVTFPPFIPVTPSFISPRKFHSSIMAHPRHLWVSKRLSRYKPWTLERDASQPSRLKKTNKLIQLGSWVRVC